MAILIGDTAPVARHFNAFMKARYERIVDFIKLHYGLTQRTDTAFWRDNADPASFTDSLKEKLAMWRCRPPQRLDFITDVEMYLPASWQYVLYGMEFKTEPGAWMAPLHRGEEARREFAAIAQLGAHALRDLPPHRTLIEQILARADRRAA